MEILKPAKAGTLESSDIYITIYPNESEGINIKLESIVMKQFGSQIKRVITKTLEEMGVENADVIAVDKGALDCTIQARVEAAAIRSSK
ncbi:citrate lyase subunit gamma (acyl carrier protein) [Dethiosulfatibacter aminovorans DSM 17477]|uniref:Citrate lyase acyl carrier protein n=1 Tax=Dethiosulfatibacter aminovorans DSM 17477 TaxID=1121476 RepID=A0A1M6FM70_9FIRM|nr:citrate lyase acyl carrier protein [Dethiosulfatibacter aminovorans]SHI98752.1 citrate lyase subunit gamma (acyl carrier protein) [Dethiosulfatibacter aminovorans DSM 17477]